MSKPTQTHRRRKKKEGTQTAHLGLKNDIGWLCTNPCATPPMLCACACVCAFPTPPTPPNDADRRCDGTVIIDGGHDCGCGWSKSIRSPLPTPESNDVRSSSMLSCSQPVAVAAAPPAADADERFVLSRRLYGRPRMCTMSDMS